MDLHLEVLNEIRKSALPKLAAFKNDFYLAGGTGLALQIGHRISVDFDFFRLEAFDPAEMRRKVELVFSGQRVEMKSDAENTLHMEVDEDIKLTFLRHPYKMVGKLAESEFLRFASFEDIGCMKLLAILDRHYYKDFVDLYAICQKLPLAAVLEASGEKYPTINPRALMLNLQYYDDLVMENIEFKNNFFVDLKIIEAFFKQEIKKLFDIKS